MLYVFDCVLSFSRFLCVSLALFVFSIAGIKWEPFYGAVWLLNGVAQSFGWPCNVKIVGNWFGGDAHRGAVFGFWSACVSMGNIVGGLVGFIVLEIGLGWEAVFIASALLLMWATFAVANFVASSPPVSSDEKSTFRFANCHDAHKLFV